MFLSALQSQILSQKLQNLSIWLNCNSKCTEKLQSIQWLKGSDTCQKSDWDEVYGNTLCEFCSICPSTLRQKCANEHRLGVTNMSCTRARSLTLILLTWRIWWAPNNTTKWHIGFNSTFKGLRSFYGSLGVCDRGLRRNSSILECDNASMVVSWSWTKRTTFIFTVASHIKIHETWTFCTREHDVPSKCWEPLS